MVNKGTMVITVTKVIVPNIVTMFIVVTIVTMIISNYDYVVTMLTW